jgi:hypothetical protein
VIAPFDDRCFEHEYENRREISFGQQIGLPQINAEDIEAPLSWGCATQKTSTTSL